MGQTSSTRKQVGTVMLLIIIAVVSQGVHDVAIEHLGVPYPKLVGAPFWLPVVDDIVRVMCLVLLSWTARSILNRHTLAWSGVIIGLLTTCLSEAFRVPIIDFFLANGWIDRRWFFTLASLLPRLAIGFTEGFIAVLIARYFASKNVILAAAAAILAGIVVSFAVAPLTGQLASFLDAAAGVSQPGELYQPPYHLGMLTIIYLTFLEPTLATFVMARLVWPSLPSSELAKLSLFTLLILGATGRLTRLLVNSFWVQQPPVLALLSTGQFFAETMVMAILAGSLWSVRGWASVGV